MGGDAKMEEQGRILLALARASIGEKLGFGDVPSEGAETPEFLKKRQGLFVTLHIHGALRGCIGTIEPVNPLGEGVRENARQAAFSDTRFTPLTAEEFHEMDIEISLLSLPEKLGFASPEELVDKLKPGIHGVIIKSRGARATFLPQVWEQLPEAEDFLSRLCMKAGLSPTAWETDVPEVYTYEVRSFSEKI
ncbi:MAG: AmmeMemoRadiSam system protein A [Desulfobacter sp.]|nr:MAG: AmmeMemoRadiSam system protein A [Desulfobacter sp.]